MGIQENGHNFDDADKCARCGMTLEHYEDNNKPHCAGTLHRGKTFRSDDPTSPATAKPARDRR